MSPAGSHPPHTGTLAIPARASAPPSPQGHGPAASQAAFGPGRVRTVAWGRPPAPPGSGAAADVAAAVGAGGVGAGDGADASIATSGEVPGASPGDVVRADQGGAATGRWVASAPVTPKTGAGIGGKGLAGEGGQWGGVRGGLSHGLPLRSISPGGATLTSR